jgi:hypothetical protein
MNRDESAELNVDYEYQKKAELRGNLSAELMTANFISSAFMPNALKCFGEVLQMLCIVLCKNTFLDGRDDEDG